ncbi:hypothetical protein [Paraburkholderia rhizosphaerae]|uniref:Uncharacterized protein n=1 Tax=Paraburkholderia rhizosphaerae TaxID=480658 RepID=A0A4R8LKM4_9BURK|nr:hypothetical protein [Paraburkholderia rhizosphaerae]TDY45048.1 hypothetical protein BX592_11514 [Paraburkholderia rhizosphaerae]
MSALHKWRIVIVIVCVGAAMVSYTGFVRSYLDHEVQTTFFVKRYPTLQMEFYDPFANEGDDMPIEKLPPSDRASFADYCKYRFGIADDSAPALRDCKSKIPGYL